LNWRQVSETFEAGSIVVADKAVEEGVAVGVRDEEAMGDAALGLLSDGLDDAAVEALDETIGLRPIGSCQTMGDTASGADAIEGVAGLNVARTFRVVEALACRFSSMMRGAP